MILAVLPPTSSPRHSQPTGQATCNAPPARWHPGPPRAFSTREAARGGAMGEIILVRHGQANSAARDEESYGRLSELGHRQGALLGDWFRDQGLTFDQVLAGTHGRHRETAEAMGQGAAAPDVRLN